MGIETCCPITIINIIKFCCVLYIIAYLSKALYYNCNLKLEDRTLDISEQIYPFQEFRNYVQFIKY